MFLSPLTAQLPGNHKRQWIPGGHAGTAATINAMRRLVTQGKRDFRIRALAGKLIKASGAGPKDWWGYCDALYRYCRDQIRYTFDPVGVELVEQPWKIVESGIADCDSIVVLLASLIEGGPGLPCRFVTIKADAKKPDEFSHVYLQVRIPHRGWVGADATMHEMNFGWEPQGFQSKSWPASFDDLENYEDDSTEGDAMLGECPCNRDKRLGLGRPAKRGPRIAPRRMRGLGYMGASQGVVDAVTRVWNGSARAELADWRSRLDQQFASSTDLQKQLQSLPEGAMKQQARQRVFDLRQRLMQADQELYKAVEAHNQIAALFRQVGADVPNAGMRAIPQAVLLVAGMATAATLAITMTASLGIIASLFRKNDVDISEVERLVRAGFTPDQATNLITQIQNARAAGNRGWIDQISGTVGSFSQLGLVALLGFGAYVGFKYLKKSGKLS